MAILKIQQAVDTVSGLQALHEVMSKDLSQIETCIQDLASPSRGRATDSEDLDTHLRARAALHGGLVSINEILGWIRLATEKDMNGEEYRFMWPLPEVPVSPIN